MQRRGPVPAAPLGRPPRRFPGFEVAGEVVAPCGLSAVRDRRPDVRPPCRRGYAEYAKVDERNTLPVPRASRSRNRRRYRRRFSPSGRRSSNAAAGAGRDHPDPRWRLRCRHQRHPASPRLSAPASSSPPAMPRNARRAGKLGAEVAINYKTEDFVEVVKRVTEGRGVDVILDMIGGDYVNRNYEAAAEEARIVQIAIQKRARAEGRYPPADGQAALARARRSGRGRSSSRRGSRRRSTRRCGRCSRPAPSPR